MTLTCNMKKNSMCLLYIQYCFIIGPHLLATTLISKDIIQISLLCSIIFSTIQKECLLLLCHVKFFFFISNITFFCCKIHKADSNWRLHHLKQPQYIYIFLIFYYFFSLLGLRYDQSGNVTLLMVFIKKRVTVSTLSSTVTTSTYIQIE